MSPMMKPKHPFRHLKIGTREKVYWIFWTKKFPSLWFQKTDPVDSEPKGKKKGT